MNQLSETASQSAMKQSIKVALQSSADRAAHLPSRVVFIRHGQTNGNSQGMIQGSTDIPLNQHGRWQIQQTATALRHLFIDHESDMLGTISKPVSKHIVIASDLSRADETAHAFADPLNLTVHDDERLRERYFGEWEGQSVQKLYQQMPEDIIGWLDGDGSELKHHAESKPHTGERGAQAVLEWMQSCDRDTDLYVFAHGSSIAQTITYLLGGRSQHTEIMYENLIPMNNAFWAVMAPQMHRDGHISWTLVSYNEGPEIAHHLDWDRDEQ